MDSFDGILAFLFGCLITFLVVVLCWSYSCDTAVKSGYLIHDDVAYKVTKA